MSASKLPVKVSVIVTYGDHERSLAECLDSILESELESEIILIGTGSRDRSSAIVNSYQSKYPNIVIAADRSPRITTARNLGIGMARGEYLLFLSGEDMLASGSLGKIYAAARRTRADMIRGKAISRSTSRPVGIVPRDIRNKVLTGIESFAYLVRTYTYVPLVCGYMYRKEWLDRYGLRFDEQCAEGEEYWTQSAFHAARTVVLTDTDLYYLARTDRGIGNLHRNGPSYVRDMLRAGDQLLGIADLYTFEADQRMYKSCIYLNALRVYLSAFRVMTALRTSSLFELPPHNMHTFQGAISDIVSEVAQVCRVYYGSASEYEREYLSWLNNPCDELISKMNGEELDRKKIILVYNGPAWQDYGDTLKNLPPDYVITLDRKYQDRAYAVVFYMPGLDEHIYEGLEKTEGQIWVRWNMEPESKFPWMLNEKLNDIFDIRMDYHAWADVVCPYYAGFKASVVDRRIDPGEKKNKICMLISSGVNQSKREEYIAELMQYTDIDSYGRLYNNSTMPGPDRGWESKIELYGQYKFVIAFENTVFEDYVTEKLYDPLIAGSVPIYLGAPNVNEYTPGENALVDAANFGSARELARHIKQCYEDESTYMKYHSWRDKPWNKEFVRKVAIQDESPFVRLCHLLDQEKQSPPRV